ncbi:YqiA/YcfP family alpha/beta fold hydrolase [Shewanella surugensis]|uniref:Esterase YqiA n=1 Tax=Shewanella surugensis TaxID=212020 RepID=A0ABT0LFU0_9GAMM|nr:YqiA/YcfP family alpha/beta fold hydrolase [Shewanella surugensis]MCL1126429.1 esterase YqiA [Shewanella surugensis]
MLLYIHGFNSSPLSDKGVITADFMAKYYPEVTFCQPQLPSNIQDAMVLLEHIIQQAKMKGEALHYIGSSLGGYLASYLAETYGGQAVLINPAVNPSELFEELTGAQYNPYTHETYQIKPEHKSQLIEYNTAVILHPERFFVLLQTGDEVLDYKLAVQKYYCCQLLVQPGGDHSFIGYENQLRSICDFLQFDH